MKLMFRVLIRWIANALGLWIAGRLIGGISHGDDLATILLAGLALSLINSIIKPFVLLLSLPALVFTLGLFIVVINGFMVWLTAELVDALGVGTFEVATFGSAVLAGLVIGLVNYLVTTFIERMHYE